MHKKHRITETYATLKKYKFLQKKKHLRQILIYRLK